MVERHGTCGMTDEVERSNLHRRQICRDRFGCGWWNKRAPRIRAVPGLWNAHAQKVCPICKGSIVMVTGQVVTKYTTKGWGIFKSVRQDYIRFEVIEDD
jgi:hypothetical protein